MKKLTFFKQTLFRKTVYKTQKEYFFDDKTAKLLIDDKLATEKKQGK